MKRVLYDDLDNAQKDFVFFYREGQYNPQDELKSLILYDNGTTNISSLTWRPPILYSLDSQMTNLELEEKMAQIDKIIEFYSRKLKDVGSKIEPNTLAYPGGDYIYCRSTFGQITTHGIDNYSFAELIGFSSNLTPEFKLAIQILTRVNFFHTLNFDYRIVLGARTFPWTEAT